MDPADEWMRSGIFDHFGCLIASAGSQGTVVVAEVDLARPAEWRWLGSPHDRPAWGSDVP